MHTDPISGAWTNEIKEESEWGSVECEPLVTEAVWNQAKAKMISKLHSRLPALLKP